MAEAREPHRAHVSETPTRYPHSAVGKGSRWSRRAHRLLEEGENRCSAVSSAVGTSRLFATKARGSPSFQGPTAFETSPHASANHHVYTPHPREPGQKCAAASKLRPPPQARLPKRQPSSRPQNDVSAHAVHVHEEDPDQATSHWSCPRMCHRPRPNAHCANRIFLTDSGMLQVDVLPSRRLQLLRWEPRRRSGHKASHLERSRGPARHRQAEGRDNERRKQMPRQCRTSYHHGTQPCARGSRTHRTQRPSHSDGNHPDQATRLAQLYCRVPLQSHVRGHVPQG
mmetsp:Transcript_36916/g.98356  ORF Transcript_36916/g.98356 Transcript_36916/m.98356 type:complete len:284 (-) Transcript_36916:294-1145(-)